MPTGEYGDVRYGWTQYQALATSTDTSDHELRAAPAANAKICLSKASISNAHATSSTEVTFKSATTAIWRCKIPADGGNEIVFPHPIKCALGEALNFACTAGVTTISVSVSGYIEQGS